MLKIALVVSLFVLVQGQGPLGGGGFPDGGPPGFPRGPGFGPGFCGPPGMGLFPEQDWITIAGCTDVGPVCAFSPKDDQGTWVCRTVYDFFSGASQDVTMCIDPDRALSTDTCGCCGDCPAECTCPCTTFDGKKGVLIQPTGQGEDAIEFPELCLPSANALGIIASGMASCVTDCSA